MRKTTVLIVDDEPVAAMGLKVILERQPEIEVLDLCNSGAQAIQFIVRLQPDIVLLDIEMPGVSGFDVIAKIGKENMPILIFVTAHQEFALQAFEVHAFDYVLKPVDHRRLLHVFQRIKQLGVTTYAKSTAPLLTTLEAGEYNPILMRRKLSIKSRGANVIVPISKIKYVEAAGNYVRYFVGEDCYLSRTTLNKVENQLDPTEFMRIHRSKILNIEHIKRITPNGDGEYQVTLQDGSEHGSGNRYRNRIRSLFMSE